MRNKLGTMIGLLFMACGSVLAQQTKQQAEALRPATKPQAESVHPPTAVDAMLGPDDTVTIAALNCEEISKTWRIGATGDVSLPLIGRVHFAGLTVEQLEQVLSGKLKRYLVDPQVTVYISESQSRPVTIVGAVDKPGRVQLSAAKTLFEVIVLAGGPKDPGPTVTVKRAMDEGMIQAPGAKTDRDGSYSMVEFNVKEVMEGRGDAANFAILPFDVITVSPAQTQRFVHISGEVNHPGSVELVTQDAVSLMKVIAVAGGLTHTAASAKTMIMHISPEGVQTSTAFVDVGKILKGKAKDLELTSGDVVVVPPSQLKSYAQQASTSAITTGIYSALYILGKF
ncbi:MAG: polysaccharide export protein [Bryobacterales bacterium]|nr:polysaccharide export protein [Bryobacterales bacterium]